jgi:hypothetical protein
MLQFLLNMFMRSTIYELKIGLKHGDIVMSDKARQLMPRYKPQFIAF